ncbi:hypothetical protein BD626DRAFT_237514 [Schizophyllum amplum]|uniref:Uncharacterized protein n=1 Tax=Schizophyllum amplum TaxID=97359 RepID=A0A550CJE1_9AGAR|nr:hypothetical protein BD626DRAFT_237514 [Auriculariopsis ampla]
MIKHAAHDQACRSRSSIAFTHAYESAPVTAVIHFTLQLERQDIALFLHPSPPPLYPIPFSSLPDPLLSARSPPLRRPPALHCPSHGIALSLLFAPPPSRPLCMAPSPPSFVSSPSSVPLPYGLPDGVRPPPLLTPSLRLFLFIPPPPRSCISSADRRCTLPLGGGGGGVSPSSTVLVDRQCPPPSTDSARPRRQRTSSSATHVLVGGVSSSAAESRPRPQSLAPVRRVLPPSAS